MIQPAEMKGTRLIALRGGETSATGDAWNMLRASRDGDSERIKALGSRCPGLVSCEDNYTPPVHFAVREGHLAVVRYLLNHGARPALRGKTRPHAAA